LNFLHNYFDSPTKLLLDPYLAKFLDISNRSFRVKRRRKKIYRQEEFTAFNKEQ